LPGDFRIDLAYKGIQLLNSPSPAAAVAFAIGAHIAKMVAAVLRGQIKDPS
jgi:hypothetical protein